jgi:hypothetical protein
MALVWTVIGMAVGAVHAAALWRRAQRGAHAGWGAVWRLPLIGFVLVIAALAGRLLPTALGWSAGLALAGIVFLVGQRRWM